MKKLVSIFIGSDSDMPTIEEAVKMLKKFGVGYNLYVASAHRAPKYLTSLIEKSEKEGVEVFIAAAGGAAHLPGVIASKTVMPVIGVPIKSQALNGIDSLLSIVQMPGGIPVATLSIGGAGAKNAGILAVQMLALKYSKYKAALKKYRDDMEKEVISNSLKLGTK